MVFDNMTEIIYTCEGTSLCAYKWNCKLYQTEHQADLTNQKTHIEVYPWIRPGACENYEPIKK